jgi:CBS domain-containing protein
MSNAHPTAPSAGVLTQRTVRDAMQLGLFECPADADLASVARTMAEKRIHCVVVGGIDRRSRSGAPLAWGVVSDLDVMRAAASGAERLTAGQLAAADLVVVDPTDTLARATRLMAEHDTAHLVVASPQTGRPVGMISTLDIARALAGMPRA